MARTFGGFLFWDAAMLSFIQAAGTVALTRNAQADLSINVSASSTAQVFAGLDDVKRPYFTFPAFPGQGTVLATNEFNEAFGTTPGTPGAAGPGNPFSGGATSFSGTPSFPWGLAIVDVVAYYSVVTNPLTTATITLARNTYAEGVANAQTVILNATALATTTTANATTLHVQKTTLSQPLTFESVDNSDILAELIITVPAGGSSRIYGIGMHVAVEYS